ncbi:restriction endonuclease [Nocardia gipuzkoensis]|uniref:restriction endonuclease n=1 Tax=Nocardia gipuzkoensis TaxID=2749991 RepID=UPI003EDF488F
MSNLHRSINATYDMAVIAAVEEVPAGLEHVVSERSLSFSDVVKINGVDVPRAVLPEFSGLSRRRSLWDEKLRRSSLPTVVTKCPFCKVRMQHHRQSFKDPWRYHNARYVVEDWGYDPEDYDTDSFLSAVNRLDHCEQCGYWRLNELQSDWTGDRGLLWQDFTLTVCSSKLRSFDPQAPEGTLEEVAQWFKRRPSLYHTVSPTYLEQLVAKVFRESDDYVDVRHIGGPDDGGVDVLLIENQTRQWLVQVKRRESPTSSESVSTIRNLLGAMVLKKSTLGAVVSTADHFTYRAREAVANAASVGYTITLHDRASLDALLARSLPLWPWTKVLNQISAQRVQWLHRGELRSDHAYVPIHDENQLFLF